MREIERITRAVGNALLVECWLWKRIKDRRIQHALEPNVREFCEPYRTATEARAIAALISCGKWHIQRLLRASWMSSISQKHM